MFCYVRYENCQDRIVYDVLVIPPVFREIWKADREIVKEHKVTMYRIAKTASCQKCSDDKVNSGNVPKRRDRDKTGS